MGHEVIGSWLDEVSVPLGMPKQVFDKQLAIKDLTEVKMADCLIVDVLEESTTGGRMVEWGIALAQPKLRYMVGDHNCLFYRLADNRFTTWDALLEHFRNYHVVNEEYTATGMEGKEFS